MEDCVCGDKYRDLRTGLTFADVRNMMKVGSIDSKDWRHKRRNSVLGHWREIKLQLWSYTHGYCSDFNTGRKAISASYNEAA